MSDSRDARGHCLGWDCVPEWKGAAELPRPADQCACDCERCKNAEEPEDQ